MARGGRRGIPTRMTNAGGGNGSRYAWEIRAQDIHVIVEGPLCGRRPAGRMVRACQPAVEPLQGRSRGHEPVDADHHGDGQRAPGPTRDAGPGGAAADDRPRERGHVVRARTPRRRRRCPHEFGHLIGLRDEYQLHPGDFRTITGREPDVGSTAGPLGVTPLQIAQNLRAAMMARNSPNAFAAVAGVQPGAFAQQIVQQYATLGAATVPAVVAAPGVAAMPRGSADHEPRARPRRGPRRQRRARPVQHDPGADLLERIADGRLVARTRSARPRRPAAPRPGVRRHDRTGCRGGRWHAELR